MPPKQQKNPDPPSRSGQDTEQHPPVRRDEKGRDHVPAKPGQRDRGGNSGP